MNKELKKLKLGKKTTYPKTYSPKYLQTFLNRHTGKDSWTSLVCTEFTSLCPVTGQPDFARIFINYIADEKMVESKSLKLYFFSFRNHGDFHENCVQTICNDLVKLLKPRFLEVMGEFTPRGGISIFPYASHANEDERFQKMKEKRLRKYSPGKYSFPLDRIY